MRTAQDLAEQLRSVDHRGYPAYKSLRGAYSFGQFLLSIDHVQGDPFASPSNVSVIVPAEFAGFPEGLYDAPWRKVALEDHLLRVFGRELAKRSFRVGGSGKSGLLATSRPGPEVLSRSACEVGAASGGASGADAAASLGEQGAPDGLGAARVGEGAPASVIVAPAHGMQPGDVAVRFEAGFPAHGRTTDARALERMLCELVPQAVEATLLYSQYGEGERSAVQAAVDLADDQRFIRDELERRELVAFVADGSALPRASGVSSGPLRDAIPFASPDSLRVELDLPHRGAVAGMGVRRGVTLVVGGGYHGKSTLLKALQEGVYDHIAGDGRELVVTDATAVKLRAEDGRSVRDVDISLFITGLPDGRDTHRFSTVDASGSTSQAAAAIEAVEAGSRALLIDEDTSATNFMVRDSLMEAVVRRDQEPITPFVERMRDLWERSGVSSVVVAGSSGAFFSVADTVIQMDCYRAIDITDHARAVCRELGARPVEPAPGYALPANRRWSGAGLDSAAERGGGRGERDARGGKGARFARGGRGEHGRGHAGRDDRVKVKLAGRDGMRVGSGSADLRLVEQIVDPEQVAALAQLMRIACERGELSDGAAPVELAQSLLAELARGGWASLDRHGEPSCGLAMPRPIELLATINRWRP